MNGNFFFAIDNRSVLISNRYGLNQDFWKAIVELQYFTCGTKILSHSFYRFKIILFVFYYFFSRVKSVAANERLSERVFMYVFEFNFPERCTSDHNIIERKVVPCHIETFSKLMFDKTLFFSQIIPIIFPAIRTI